MSSQETVIETLETQSVTGLTIHAALAIRADANRLVCFMPAAISRRVERNPKQLSRWKWRDLMPNQHVMALADPAMGLDESLFGAWFLHPKVDLLEEMAAVVQGQVERLNLENRQVLFYGSSLGGFGALGMASLLPGSSAISEIPQIDVPQWASQGAVRKLETKILGMPFEEFRLARPEMVDVRDRFRKSGLIPPFLLVTNESDFTLDLHKEFMGDVLASDLPRSGDQHMLLTRRASGHHALKRDLALSLVETWSIDAEMHDGTALEFDPVP